MRKIGRTEREERVKKALDLVKLTGLGERKVGQLSGGQQQRVALGRALIVEPAVLLLDEPLGALDLKLREQMQIELKEIQRNSGITFVFVTHDQDEALTLADRIVVFSDGRVAQAGAPHEVYEQPASEFVAGFVGTSNVLGEQVARAVLEREGSWSIRPEKIAISDVDEPAPADLRHAVGTVEEVVYTGATTRCVVSLEAGGSLSALLLNGSGHDREITRGRSVRLSWHPDHEVRLN
jgi:putative spermidine/putrescine transport system ATP-binding protein